MVSPSSAAVPLPRPPRPRLSEAVKLKCPSEMRSNTIFPPSDGVMAPAARSNGKPALESSTNASSTSAPVPSTTVTSTELLPRRRRSTVRSWSSLEKDRRARALARHRVRGAQRVAARRENLRKRVAAARVGAYGHVGERPSGDGDVDADSRGRRPVGEKNRPVQLPGNVRGELELEVFEVTVDEQRIPHRRRHREEDRRGRNRDGAHRNVVEAEQSVHAGLHLLRRTVVDEQALRRYQSPRP